MLLKFNNLEELQKTFRTEKRCADYIANLRWGDNRYCQYCGNVKTYKLKQVGLFECKCGKKFSVRVGTIFEDSKLPLIKWFIAFWLEINHKKGVSSPQLARDLGVTVKTAWFMLHRIRWALTHNTIEKLKGDIEIDETYVGGKEKNKRTSKKV
ncbi:MAG: IS1595 family transposase [Deferribacteraceae bacterium]|jgi:hypothetical protein|nr:IS1595 family transposase [Deferribacteraceae bacterium]